MLSRLAVFALATSISMQSAIGSAPGERILVLDMTSTGVDPNLARNLSDILSLAVRRAAPSATVIGQSEVSAMIAVEKQRDVLGCNDDVSCLAQIGGALGADRLVIGNIGKVGDVHLLTLKLIDAKASVTLQHISEEVAGDEALLIEATRQWAARLLDPARPAGFGHLDIRGSGEVSLDGAKIGPAPLLHHAVAAGPHVVAWAGVSVHVEGVAYATVTVSPGEGAADSALGAAAEVEAPGRPRPVFVYASFGPAFVAAAPSGTGIKATKFVGGVEGGYRFASGLTLAAAGRGRTYWYEIQGNGVPQDHLLFGPGFGYSTAGRLHVAALAFFEASIARYSNGKDPTDNALGKEVLGVEHGGMTFAVTPSLITTYALARHFALGLALRLPITRNPAASPTVGWEAAVVVGMPTTMP